MKARVALHGFFLCLVLLASAQGAEGHRVDYVRSPVYTFADGRGKATDFGDVKATNAVIILHNRDGERHEIDAPMDLYATRGVKRLPSGPSEIAGRGARNRIHAPEIP